MTTDANGNVLVDDAGRSYTWDVRGRLYSLYNGSSYFYYYGFDGLRLAKSVNGTVTNYLLDGDSVVQENTSGTTTNLLQGPGVDNLLQRGSNWVLHGELNHVSVVTDADEKRRIGEALARLMGSAVAPRSSVFAARPRPALLNRGVA